MTRLADPIDTVPLHVSIKQAKAMELPTIDVDVELLERLLNHYETLEHWKAQMKTRTRRRATTAMGAREKKAEKPETETAK